MQNMILMWAMPKSLPCKRCQQKIAVVTEELPVMPPPSIPEMNEARISPAPLITYADMGNAMESLGVT